MLESTMNIVAQIPGNEHGHIASLGKLDHHRVLPPFRLVVIFKLGADSACFDADDRVDLWVIGRLSIKNFDPEKVLFDLIPASREHTLHCEAQEAGLAFRTSKSGTGKNLFQLNPDGIS